MKKIMLSLFCFMLALTVAGCGHNIKFNSSDVMMEVVEERITPSGLQVRISNNTKVNICGGIEDDFVIEKMENDKWSPVKEVADRTDNTETYIFQGERHLNIYWTELYGTLSTGKYRIIKYFYPWTQDGTYGLEDGFYLTAEFSIE